MATRSLGCLARLKPAAFHRCTVPVLERLGAASNRNRHSREDDRYPRALISQTRDIHVTRRSDSTALLAGAGIAASAMIARYGLSEYKKYQAMQPGAKEEAEAQAAAASASDQPADGKTNKTPPGGAGAGTAPSASGLFGAFGKRYYEGGFEDKMTRKEAALILGVRESAAAQRIKDSHRRILMINHPDKGGSKYMAAKINEAKEILLKGRK